MPTSEILTANSYPSMPFYACAPMAPASHTSPAFLEGKPKVTHLPEQAAPHNIGQLQSASLPTLTTLERCRRIILISKR